MQGVDVWTRTVFVMDGRPQVVIGVNLKTL